MSLKHSTQTSFCSSPSHIIIKIVYIFIYLTYWPMSSSWAEAISSLYQQHPTQCLECNIKCRTWTEWAAEIFLSPFLVLPSAFLSWAQHSQLPGIFPAFCFLPISLSYSILSYWQIHGSNTFFLWRTHWAGGRWSESMQAIFSRGAPKVCRALEMWLNQCQPLKCLLYKTTVPQLSSNILSISWLHLMSLRRGWDILKWTN